MKTQKAIASIVADYGYTSVHIAKSDTPDRINGFLSDAHGSKYFFKLATGRLTYPYRSLSREATVTSIVSDYTYSKPVQFSGYRLFVPAVANIIQKEDWILLVTRFVPGKKLSALSKSSEADFLYYSFELIKKLKNIPYQDIRPYVVSYTKYRLIAELPFRAAKVIIRNKTMWVSFLQLFARSLGMVFLKNTDNGLVHPDLNATNIVIDKKNIYITDWEEAGWGMTNYTIATALGISWQNEMFRKIIRSSYHEVEKHEILLLTYIKIFILYNQQLPLHDTRRVRDQKTLHHFLTQKDTV